MKKCHKCGLTKPVSEFYPARTSTARDKLSSRCKKCAKAVAHEHYKRNREKLAAAAKERMARERREQGDRVRARETAYWAKPENRARRRAQNRKAGERLTPEQRANRRANWERWKERNLEHERARIRLVQASRNARKRLQFVEDVDARVVLERDDGICGICGAPVDPNAFHVDHIVPLSKGGEHSYANVQVAHPFCNISKGAKLAA